MRHSTLFIVLCLGCGSSHLIPNHSDRFITLYNIDKSDTVLAPNDSSLRFLKREHINFYGRHADSIFELIHNSNTSVYTTIPGRSYSFVQVGFDINGTNYLFLSIHRYYLKNQIIPNLKDTTRDWAYNVICYQVSSRNALNYEDILRDQIKWRGHLKDLDIEYWDSYKWK